MSMFMRILMAVVVGGAVFMSVAVYDKMTGAEWVVSPEQINEAKRAGKQGYESKPGTVTVRPIRKETADMLPFKWAALGIGAGLGAFFVTGRRKRET